jgi:2-octaprenyl-6-methoxyphenol hydroxylase
MKSAPVAGFLAPRSCKDLSMGDAAQPLALVRDVAVVGAGPAGLAAALALAHVGARVVLIGPSPVHGSESPGDTRTAALLQSSVDLLKALKVFDALFDQAAPLKAIRIIDVSDHLLRSPEIIFLASELDLDTFGYNIPNTALVKALYAQAMQTLDAVEPDSVARIEPGADHLRLTCSNGKAFKARLVVGADGRRSICRAAAGIAADERRYEQAAIATSFGHARDHDFISTEIHLRAGLLTTVPLPEPRASSLIWVGETAEIEGLMRLDDIHFSAALDERLGGLLGSVDTVGARASFPLTVFSAKELGARRTALVGEAAHILLPIGAQGLNLGLRDAAALADCMAAALRRGSDPGGDEVLKVYAAARRIDIATRTVGVDLLSRSLLTDLLPVQVARSLVLHGLSRIAPMRRLVMRAGLAPPTELPSLMRPRASL